MVLQKVRAWLSANGRGDGGPPDLDEIWRDLGAKLNALLGRWGRPGGPGRSGEFGRSPSGKPSSRLWVILTVIAVLVWMASGFYIVVEGQQGVVLRFGKFSELTGPGLRWRLPYPIGNHVIVNVTGVRTVEIGYRGSEANKMPKEALMVTDDENIVNIQFAIQFQIRSDKVRDFVFNNRSIADGGRGGEDGVHGEDWVRQVAETSIREVIGKSKMDYVLYEGREQIAVATAKLMQQILDRYQTGILVSRVTMQNAQPPEKVQEAFSDAVRAGQDRERQKNEGQAYANDVIPRAKGDEARLLAEAEGYRARVVSVAEGDVARFDQILVEYNRAPAVTKQRIYIDTMQEIMQNVAKVMVDKKSGNQMLYVPLDRLRKSSGGADPVRDVEPSTQAQPSSVQPPVVQSAGDSRAVIRRPRADRGGRP